MEAALKRERLAFVVRWIPESARPTPINTKPRSVFPPGFDIATTMARGWESVAPQVIGGTNSLRTRNTDQVDTTRSEVRTPLAGGLRSHPAVTTGH